MMLQPLSSQLPPSIHFFRYLAHYLSADKWGGLLGVKNRTVCLNKVAPHFRATNF